MSEVVESVLEAASASMELHKDDQEQSQVNPGSKAAQKGIREGDVISSINGQSTRTITNSDAHALLRNAGQTLHLGLNEECSGSPKRRQYRTVQEVKTSESIRRSNSVSSSSCASTSTTVKTVPEQTTTTVNGLLTSDTSSKKSDSQNGAVTKGASSTSSSASNGKGPVKIAPTFKATSPVPGVWTPSQKSSQPEPSDPPKTEDKKKEDDATAVVWTPRSAGASPTAERKEFRPVSFESPTLARKNRSPTPAVSKPEDTRVSSTPSTPPATSTTEFSSILPPWQHEEHITTSTTTSTTRLVQSQSAPASGLSVLAGGGPSSTTKLPRAQNPTITLLQKAREGQLPRGALYLDHKMSSKDDRSRVGENEILYSVKNEYVKDSEGGQQKKVVELTPRKFEGIGPTTKEGIPIGLRSEVKDINQAKWYKRMYDSLHRAGKDDDYITIRYKPRRGHYPYAYAGGYLSEPEPAGYDSDIGYSAKYATLDRRRIKNKENDFTTSTLPRSKYVPHPSSLKYATDVYKNQPGRIEDYEPGHSSISEKEAKQWWDEVLEIFDGWLDTHASPPNYRSLLADAVYQRASTNQHRTAPSTPSNKPFMTYALKESGYESDSTLVFKRRDENLQNQISPAEQKMAYKTIQKGGDVPLQGLRKPAPERPKDISEIEYFPISPHLTRIRVHKQNITPLREIICYPVTTHTTSPPPVFSSYKRTAPSYIYVSPAVTRPAPPPPMVPPSPPRRRSSRHNTTLQMWSKMRHGADSDIKSRHSSCFKSSPGDTNVKYLRDRLSHKFESSSSTTSPAHVCRMKESSRASSAMSRTTSLSPARSSTRKPSPDNQPGVKHKSDSSLQRSRRAQQELSTRLSRSPDLSAPSAVKKVLQKQKQDVKERPGSRSLPPGTVVRSSTAVYASARNSPRHSEDKSLRVTVAISAKGRELLGSSAELRRGPYSKSPSPSVSPSSVGRRTSASPRSRMDSLNVGSTGRSSPSLSTIGSKSKSKTATNSPPTSAVKRPARSASRELVSSDTSRPLRPVRAAALTPAAAADEGTKKIKKPDKAISDIRKRTREKISAALSKTPPIPTTKTLVKKSSATICTSPVGENTKKDDKPAIESTLKKKITRKLKADNGNSSNGTGETKKTSSSRKNGTHSKQSSRSKTNSDSASGKKGKTDKLVSSETCGVTQVFPNTGLSTMEEPLSQFGSELDLTSHIPGPLKSDSFFQHLLLRDIQSPTPSVSSSLCRSSSVLEKARKFYEQTQESRLPYKSEPYLGLLNVYLSQKRPVTESKFRSLDRESRTSRSPSPSRVPARPGRYHSFHSSPRVMDYVAGYHSLGPSRGRSPDSVVESVKERRSISEPPIPSTSTTTRSQSPAMSVRRVSPSSSTRRLSPPPSPTPSPSCRRIRGTRGQIARTVESVVGVKRKGVRARSAGEVDDLKNHRRTRSPLPSTTQSISSLNLSHITDHSDYQSYVLELMHSTKKSERFRELHKFYASLERMGQLERTTSTGDLRPRLKGEEVIDFDRWKQLRIKEKAEQELKVLYDKLKEDQREKDLLFMPHDAESLRWKEERDIGLRCKDKSVEDLRYHFRKLSIEESEIESSRRKEIDSQKDLYKPLWRGSSVLNLASSLTHTVASHRGRAVIDESKVKQDRTITKSSPPPIAKKLGKGIGSRLWSSLSLDQVNALKHQLSEIYSSVSNLRSHKKKAEQEKSKEDYEITVPPKEKLEAGTVQPDKEPLHVRCNSLLTREQLYSPMVRRREARRTESMKADSISSLPHCRRNGVDGGSPKAEVVRSQSARAGKPLSETEKKRLSLTLSQEVLDRVTKKQQKDPPPVVMARETRGAIAAAAASKSKLKTPSPSYSPLLSETASPRTCYSLEMSEEDGHATASTSGGHRSKNDFLLVLTPNDDSQSRHHEVQKVVEEWANAKPHKPPQPEEVRCVDNGATAKLVKTTSASETESASSETSTRTVIHCSSKEDVQRKVEYFEHRSMVEQEPKRIGARVCRSASDIRPSRPYLLTSSSRAKSAPSSFSSTSQSVQPAPREKPSLIPSQSYADLKELFGEQHRARYATVVVPTQKRQQSTSPLRCGTTSGDDGELRSGGTSPFRTYYSSSSTESLFKSRSRSVSPDPTKYWRAYLRMVRCGSVRRLREKFESLEDLYLTARGRERIPLKRYRSDPELTRDLLSRHGTYANRVVVRGQECGDVRWLRRRYEGYNTRGRSRARKGRVSPVLKVPLRAEDRFMPHINVISKTATLQQQRRAATLPSRELDSEDYITHYHKGEVQRMKRKFESMQKDLSLMGQMFTSTPDVRELRHIAPYLGCHWIAHRYPEPHTPSPRSLSSPELRPPAPTEPRRRPASSSPARPRSSILKQQQQTLPQPPPSPKHESRTRDVFANQEFDPSIHRPVYRYQPPVSADSSGSQWWWRHPPTRPTVTFKESPHRYVESEVTIHYRSPVRSEAKEALSEEELAHRQAEAMRRIYQEERRRKYLQELQDMHSRRHTDNFTPSQKSPIPLNRYDDILDDVPTKAKPRDRTPEPKLVARALYNFVGQTSRELSFRRGDIIFVRRQIDKNWYEGEHNAMVGLFPFNYVEIIPYDGIRTIPKKPTEGQARAKFNFIAQTHLELSLVKGELVVLTRRVDENWFEGRIGTRKGIFPVSYVEVLSEPGERAVTPATPTAKPVASPASHSHSLLVNGSTLKQHSYQSQQHLPTTGYYSQTKLSSSYTSSNPYATLPRHGETSKPSLAPMNQTLHIDTHSEPVPYRALYNYRPQNEDELELREGDTVYVMEKCDDGWYVGSSQRTGYFGTFPGNYVERL
ncbi:uncharacterized protein CAP [Anabrus simplex]|uniref:uncharacterized protein CAP n=1 Tax=Anabrus simplex TaxID=316456 RepID=UPI0035A29F18